MKLNPAITVLVMFGLTSCLVVEEEPILLIDPSAEISAHIKDQKIYATAVLNANPMVLTAGNIPTIFEFSGELAIYNTENGNIIDVNTFTGGGLSQVYSVSADTSAHERFIVVASGTVNAYANIGNDNDDSNDKLISRGDFYQEAQFVIAEMVNQLSQ
ncbi:MAG: hypothetical protein KAT15_18010 [Bacteroidales bacterium]|nr:hypothetical protein [Bacteroidales bacterium]